jgi:RNA polymerase sigma-70 factor, ECF subfamily
VCRRLTGNDADAADAAQETMIALVRNLDRFDGRSLFSTWAYRVAVNASLDELRRRRRRPEPRAVGGDATGAGEMSGDEVGAPAGRVASSEADVDNRLEIDAALRLVPADFRAAVVLRDLCTLDYAEISEVLGIPVGTVRSRISRGRALLATLLAPAGGTGQTGGNPTASPQRPTTQP